VVDGYREQLADILAAHEQFGLRPHQRKFELVKGDVAVTFPAYLEQNPETIVALAYLDLDLYDGTIAVLNQLSQSAREGLSGRLRRTLSRPVPR
jgi:hypothetical protein